MRRDSFVDYFLVPAHQREMDARLHNWSRWCNGSETPSTSPTFRLYIAPARARGAEHTWSSTPVDGMDAQRMQKAVTQLPDKHRAAINWCYVRPCNPRKAAQTLAVTLEGLALLVRDSRQMLLNRGA